MAKIKKVTDEGIEIKIPRLRSRRANKKFGIKRRRRRMRKLISKENKEVFLSKITKYGSELYFYKKEKICTIDKLKKEKNRILPKGDREIVSI